MTHSERLDAKRLIIESLSSRDYVFIDLLLSEFGLPTWEEYSGSREQYVANALLSASDDQIFEIREYLAPTQPITAGGALEIWKQSGLRVFISHKWSERELADAIKAMLAMYGLQAFVAHVDIETTSEWRHIIESALHSSDALVALLSTDFHESDWTDQEVGYAIGLGRLVVPVRLDPVCDPYGIMGKFQGSPITRDTTTIVRDMLKVLLRHKSTRGATASSLARALANSDSFKQSKLIVRQLEGMLGLTEDDLQQISEALRVNNQVSEAFGVKAKVEKLLRDHKYLSQADIDYDPFGDE